jgi:hypothetical protein
LQKWIGIPKYLKGKVPAAQPKRLLYSSSPSFAFPKQNTSLLWRLNLRPDYCSKIHKSSVILSAFSKSWFILFYHMHIVK